MAESRKLRIEEIESVAAYTDKLKLEIKQLKSRKKLQTTSCRATIAPSDKSTKITGAFGNGS